MDNSYSMKNNKIKNNLIELNSPKELVKAMKIYTLSKNQTKIYNLIKPQIIKKCIIKKISDNFSLNKAGNNLKHEKKNRFLKKLDENLEIKKNRNKQKKRSKTKLYLREDEDHLNELSNKYITIQDNKTVSLSLVRPSKPHNDSLQTIKNKQLKTTNSNNINIKLEKEHKSSETIITTTKSPKSIKLGNNITVKQLSEMMMIPEQDIIKFLFLKGKNVTINQVINITTANLIGENFGINIETKDSDTEEILQIDMLDKSDPNKLVTRPPIVTIMGHIDHGKTTLVDSIRNTRQKAVDKEKGSITQLIGTYEINIKNNNTVKTITLLDTPGHEAFAGMRARSAKLTDIGILVIATDDGIKEQTVEAIKYLQRKKIPLIVVLTKTDKDNANIEKVKKELINYNIIPEDLGGNIPIIPVSAPTGKNISKLLQTILITAELENLQANPYRTARGTIIESYIDRRTGPIATIIIQNGTLKLNNIISAGNSFGKIKVITDCSNQRIEVAGPSSAVKIWGLSKIAPIGENFEVHETEREAKERANLFSLSRTEDTRYSSLFNQYQYENINTYKAACLQIILKTQNQGSIEAILYSLSRIPQRLVHLQILLANVGEITESDVDLAYSTNAWLIGFNTTLASGTKQASEKIDVKISGYQVIYDLVKDTMQKMEDLLKPEYIEEEIGVSKVKAIFYLSKGITAGCYVNSGKLKKNAWIHIIRNNKVIHKGILESLKKIKEDVKEIDNGFECGIFIENFQNWQIGDMVKCFDLIKQRVTLK
uniref:Translation initiation factor IF-2, chloroplastic n=1 Tax=Boldia erythrosiphon TaxID=74908 RepID=A0A1Y9TLP9_9RHOD|nr:initiation factor IF2 [Boldia erythrosiphon]ARO90528.1 initiation factor IF2 [Boldia erythrosiphon]